MEYAGKAYAKIIISDFFSYAIRLPEGGFNTYLTRQNPTPITHSVSIGWICPT
jgi:hypothetical protein